MSYVDIENKNKPCYNILVKHFIKMFTAKLQNISKDQGPKPGLFVIF